MIKLIDELKPGDVFTYPHLPHDPCLYLLTKDGGSEQPVIVEVDEGVVLSWTNLGLRLQQTRSSEGRVDYLFNLCDLLKEVHDATESE